MQLLRTVATLAIVLLLAVALVWGGCVSCSQYFVFASSHGCCNPTGHCGKVPTPNAKECRILPVAPAKAVAVAPPVVTAVILPVAAPAPALPVRMEREAFVPTDALPPDLYLHYSVFRI